MNWPLTKPTSWVMSAPVGCYYPYPPLPLVVVVIVTSLVAAAAVMLTLMI